jgi:hypothetical protein
MGQGGRVSDKGRGAGTCLHPGISRPCFGVLSPVARARLRHVTQCKAGFSQSMDSFFQRLNVLTCFAVLPPGRAPRRKEKQTWCGQTYTVLLLEGKAGPPSATQVMHQNPSSSSEGGALRVFLWNHAQWCSARLGWHWMPRRSPLGTCTAWSCTGTYHRPFDAIEKAAIEPRGGVARRAVAARQPHSPGVSASSATGGRG